MPEIAPPTDVAHLKLLNCARGHFWESTVAADGSPRSAACPTCGAPADVLPLLDLQTADGPLPPPVPTPLPPPYQDKAGKPVVGGYEVLDDLGKGTAGLGQHRARQIVVNRIVVLKTVLARDDPSQQAWGSLRSEAAALAKLPHPNIVAIFEAGDRERQLFYNALESVEGPNLGSLIANKPLPVPQALELVEVLARAVHFAHEKGVIHRGLRPQTVLLAVQRTDKKTKELPEPPACTVHAVLCIPKIAGYGLAKSRLVEGDVTDQELQDRFPCYLTPEQAWGRSKEIGTATDVYALGAILYECLTGQPPFKGSSPATTLEQIQSIDPLPIARLRRSGVSADIEAILRKCLHKQPRRRYASARELADDLRRAAEGRPTQARDANFLVRSGQWSTRNPMAFVAVAVAVLGLIGMIAATVSGNRAVETVRQEKVVVELERNNTRGELLKANADVARLRKRADIAEYFQNIARAETMLERRPRGDARSILDACPEKMRNAEWYILRQRADGIEPRLMGQFHGPVTSLAWSPDGQFLAASATAPLPGVQGNQGEVRAWQVSNGFLVQGLREFNVPPTRQVAFHPDGKLMAWATREGLTFWDRKQPRAIPCTGPNINQQFPHFCYTSDGVSVLMIEPSGTIRRLDARSGQPLPQPNLEWFGRDGQPLIIALDPQGIRYAAVNPGQLSSVTLFDGTQYTPLFPPHANSVTDLAYYPTSGILATSSSDNTIRLWRPLGNVGGPPPTFIGEFRGHAGGVTCISFNPDGKRLASCGDDNTVRIWDVQNPKELLTVQVPTRPTALAFSPKDNRLAVAYDNKVFIYGSER